MTGTISDFSEDDPRHWRITSSGSGPFAATTGTNVYDYWSYRPHQQTPYYYPSYIPVTDSVAKLKPVTLSPALAKVLERDDIAEIEFDAHGNIVRIVLTGGLDNDE